MTPRAPSKDRPPASALSEAWRLPGVDWALARDAALARSMQTSLMAAQGALAGGAIGLAVLGLAGVVAGLPVLAAEPAAVAAGAAALAASALAWAAGWLAGRSIEAAGEELSRAANRWLQEAARIEGGDAVDALRRSRRFFEELPARPRGKRSVAEILHEAAYDEWVEYHGWRSEPARWGSAMRLAALALRLAPKGRAAQRAMDLAEPAGPSAEALARALMPGAPARIERDELGLSILPAQEAAGPRRPRL